MEDKELDVNPLENLLDESEEIVTPSPEKEEENSPKEEQEEEKEELTPKQKRHAEQIAWAKAEVERLRQMVINEEVRKASADAKSLLELAETDLKLADEVAKKFGYTNFKDAKKQIVSWEQTEPKADVPTEEKFEEWYQQRKAKEEHEAAIEEAKAIIDKLPDDVQEEAIETFNELIDWKTLTKDKALKFANMITLSYWKPKKTDNTEWLKKLSTTWLSNSKKPSKDDDELVIVDGKAILLNSNQLK